jgi:hypothetical protein
MNTPLVPYTDLTAVSRTQLLNYYSNLFGVSKLLLEHWILEHNVVIDPAELKMSDKNFSELENYILTKQG